MIVYYWRNKILFFYDFKLENEVGIREDGYSDYSFSKYKMKEFNGQKPEDINIIYDGRKSDEKKT